MNKHSTYILLFVLSFLFIYKMGDAQKIDSVYHINGDVLTGDFKKMTYGIVTYKMDGMGTISIEVIKIKTMKSIKKFEIKMKNGVIYFGSIDTSSVDMTINIITNDTTTTRVHIAEIVEIYPIKSNFWMRSSGSFSLGLNFSKGSDITTLPLSGNMDYRITKSYFDLSFDNNSTFQGDSLSSSKADITFMYQQYLKLKWSNIVSVGVSQNLELGTRLRLELYDVIINDIVYNDWNRFYTGAGLGVTSETPYDDSGIKQDMVGLVTVVWKVFKYSKPKLWINSNINFVPYFTNIKRIRTVFNLNPKISIINDDFKVGFKFYFNFDNQPQTEAAAKTDYGINLQFTYSFH